MIYYNEIEPFAARWLRNLAQANHIAPGIVDDRSIAAVAAAPLRAFTQAHFFAGIGVWSRALRLAGWPDDEPVWTGSCPCQPFSTAGRRGGFDDARHLWPTWYERICVCRPSIVFGEQVANGDGLAWLDVVSTDLERAGYAVGAADLCAAGVGAPHIRQRLFFVAVGNNNTGLERRRLRFGAESRQGKARAPVPFGRLADDDDERRRLIGGAGLSADGNASQWYDADRRGAVSIVGDTGGGGSGRDARADASAQAQSDREWGIVRRRRDELELAGATNGFWAGADWIDCTDGKTRPVEPGAFPLVDGVANRVGRVRAYGNAIVAPLAAAFIRAVMDVL